MILEADEETRDFVTIYKKDFYPKQGKRVNKIIQPPNFNPPLNALNGPFKEHLNSLLRNERVPLEEKTEDLRDNLQRIRSKYQHLAKFLPATSPDENVIEAERKKAFRTIYQLEYSRHLDDYISLHAKRTGDDRPSVTLPEGWIIPETIHKTSFRDPRGKGTTEGPARPNKINKSRSNLDPNEKEREILRVATGNSEYDDIIGATGDRILKEQLHGIPLPLDPHPPRLKGPDSIRSDCSTVLMPRRQDESICNKFV